MAISGGECAQGDEVRRIQQLLQHLSPAVDESRPQSLSPAPTNAELSEFHYGGKFKEDDLQLSYDTGLLTREQREQYERDGFFVVRGLVKKELLEKYRNRFIDICDGKTPRPAGMIVMKDVAICKTEVKGERFITKVQDFQDEEVLSEYTKLPEILRYIEVFCGPNIKSVHSMLINKPPDPGSLSSRHPMHQDLYYFPFRPAHRIVCSWTAMEKVNRANGCLVVVPGSHKGRLMAHGYPEWEGGVNKAYHGIKDLPSGLKKVYLEMESGDTVFFHPLLYHGSGANRTKGYRKAISCHYASADGHYIDVKGTVQEEIADEVKQMLSKRLKRDVGMSDEELTRVGFEDIWRMKSRLLQGRAGNL